MELLAPWAGKVGETWLHEIALALVEHLTNIVRHAYGETTQGLIFGLLTLAADRVTIETVDRGGAVFDALMLTRATALQNPLEHAREGGARARARGRLWPGRDPHRHGRAALRASGLRPQRLAPRASAGQCRCQGRLAKVGWLYGDRDRATDGTTGDRQGQRAFRRRDLSDIAAASGRTGQPRRQPRHARSERRQLP